MLPVVVYHGPMSLALTLRPFAWGALNPDVTGMVLAVKRLRITYLTFADLLDLAEAARTTEAAGVPGAFVEAGCALGGSGVILASVKTRLRPMFMFDTFGMIPPPSERDGVDVHARYSEIEAGRSKGIDGETYYGYRQNLMDEVANTLTALGHPPAGDNIQLVRGLFEHTLHLEGPVALAHLDCDWHDSVRVCLERIVPRLSPGGRLVIDDYDAWSGCRTAVDAYFADKRQDFEFSVRRRLHIIRRDRT